MTTCTSYKRLGGLLALFLLFVVAPALRADTITWDWSFTGTAKGKTPAYTGEGTIVAESNSGGGYTIMDVTGTWNGYTIDGISNYAGGDILLTSLDDLDSISFTVSTPTTKKGVITYSDVDWNIKSAGNHVQATGKGSPTEKGDFTLELLCNPIPPLTTSPAPEPSSIVLLGTAMMALLGLVWFRKQNPAAVTAA